MMDSQDIRKKRWAIAEGYIPQWSQPEPELKSHETACILNAGDEDAHVQTENALLSTMAYGQSPVADRPSQCGPASRCNDLTIPSAAGILSEVFA